MRIKQLLYRFAGMVLGAVLCLTNVMTTYANPEWPSDTGILANAGIVVDMDSGAVLFGQQIHVPLPPASITKLLTALVVVENAGLDEMVTFSHDAVYNVESGSGNKLALEEGDALSVRDCLYVMLLLSSNQAANALAEHVGGSRSGFVEMMNQRIDKIGCQESRFANPSGLNDEKQRVSAYDMALIAMEAFANETVLEISSARKYSIPATINNPDGASFSMEHRLLKASEDPSSQYYCEGALAGKTGYTSLAGNTLVTMAKRDGRRVISVILKGTQPQYYMDGKELINFGFSAFQNVPIEGNETLLSESQELELGETTYQTADLSIEEAVVTLPKTAQLADAQREIVTELPEDAPSGAAALIRYTYNERKIGEAYLYSQSLKKAQLEAMEGDRETDAKAAAVQSPDAQLQDGDKVVSEAEPSDQEAVGNGGAWLGKILLILVILGALGGGAYVLKKYQDRQREEAAKRRERRRQRLEEMGCSEAEFEKLLQERRAGKRKG